MPGVCGMSTILRCGGRNMSGEAGNGMEGAGI